MDTPTAAQPNPNAETRLAVVLDDGSTAVQATRDLLAKQAYAVAPMTADTAVDGLTSVEALCEMLRHALTFAQQEGARLVALPITADAALLVHTTVPALFGALQGVIESARQAGVVAGADDAMMLAAPFVNETAAAVASLASAVSAAKTVAQMQDAADRAAKQAKKV